MNSPAATPIRVSAPRLNVRIVRPLCPILRCGQRNSACLDRTQGQRCGGDGVDRLRGGAGDDTISGGDRDDHILGGADADVIEGGAGFDLFGGKGTDVFVMSDGFGYNRSTYRHHLGRKPGHYLSRRRYDLDRRRQGPCRCRCRHAAPHCHHRHANCPGHQE